MNPTVVLVSSQLRSSDTLLRQRAPTCALTPRYLPFLKLFFSSRTIRSAAAVVKEQIRNAFPCREQPGLHLHSFLWGHFCELHLAQPWTLASDLTCGQGVQFICCLSSNHVQDHYPVGGLRKLPLSAADRHT